MVTSDMPILKAIADLVPEYFVEPDVFKFTQNNGELCNMLLGTTAEEALAILTEASVDVRELNDFLWELESFRKLRLNDFLWQLEASYKQMDDFA